MERRTGRELVVVGGGVAGWTAARRAQQLGVDVLVVDRHDEGPGLGNGRYSGGWFHAAYLSPYRPPRELYDAIVRKTGGATRSDVARAWAGNVARALDFLKAEGGVFAPAGPDEYMQNVLQPARGARVGLEWRDFGPDRLLRRLWTTFTEAGGGFRPATRAVELVTGPAGVVGVRDERGSVLHGAAVLLADGGFQANPDLVHRHITGCYTLRGAPNATGDALAMGTAAGARPVELRWFYGHCLLRDTLTRGTELWPYPSPWPLLEGGGILVDGAGLRFFDEGLGDEQAAVAIAHHSTPGACWAVFDELTWKGPAAEGPLPLNPVLLRERTTVASAVDLPALAATCGLPPDRLGETVGAYNASAGEPVRSGARRPLAVAPFHAVPLVAGITLTMGGLLVDGRGRVLGEDDRPIPGLYAAGGSMGGLQGGTPAGYTGGWSEAATFGLLAAEHVASSGRERREAIAR